MSNSPYFDQDTLSKGILLYEQREKQKLQTQEFFNTLKEWNDRLADACKIGRSIQQVEEIIKQGVVACGTKLDYDQGLLEASGHGHLEIVKLMITHGALERFGGFRNACERGHWKIVKFFINKSVGFWNFGLQAASRGGQLIIIEKLISHASSQKIIVEWNWNDALYQACNTEHLEIAKFMIAKGANDFNRGFKGACHGGYFLMIHFMIKCGANNFGDGLEIACQRKNAKLIKLMLGNGARLCLRSDCQDYAYHQKHLNFTKSFVIELLEERVPETFLYDAGSYDSDCKEAIFNCFLDIKMFKHAVSQLDILLPVLSSIVLDYSLV